MKELCAADLVVHITQGAEIFDRKANRIEQGDLRGRCPSLGRAGQDLPDFGDRVCLRQMLNFAFDARLFGVFHEDIGTAQDGMEQPEMYWDPSIAPSGLMVYQGDMFPEWLGNIFVGSLKFDYISRIDATGPRVREVAQIENSATNRVRDIVEAPDGSIWFISVGNGAIYRMARD